MSAQIIHAKFEMTEVFEAFAAGLVAPEGYVISRANPHHDPRQGTVIFECYVEPVAMTIPADQSYPVAPVTDSSDL